jgi:hypothetical protein
MDANIIELEKDLHELDKLIEISTRQNIKRNLENHKKTIASLIESEKKLHETKKVVSTEDIDKNHHQLTAKVEDKYKYITIDKYAFESSEKFAK